MTDTTTLIDDAPAAALTFLDAMRRSAAVAGDERGIRFYSDEQNSERLGYAELDERARARAVGLARRGYGPGDVAVLAFDPGFGFIEAVYAALYAGMAIAPVPVAVGRNPRAVIERLEAIVADAGSRLVLTEASALTLLEQASLRGVEVSLLSEPDPALAGEWTLPAITADSIALLQYTSGSTGAPKGVIVTHGNLVANEEAIGAAVGDGAHSVWVGWLPHYHDMGLIGLLFRPIFAGSDSVLTSPSRFLRRPLFWLRLITRHRGTFTVAPDFAYRLCAQVVTDEQLAELDLSSLRQVVTGAEPVKIGTVRDFADRFAPAGLDPTVFIPAYGMAETTLIISAAVGREVRAITADLGALEKGDLLPAADGRTVDLVMCGPSVPGAVVAIVAPDTGVRLPDGRIGEIWVSGPSVTQGYWGRPEETAHSFGQRLEGEPGSFLRTGDLGAIVDGEVVVAGRLKDLIISNGRNIFPQDVEAVASTVVTSDPGCLAAAFELAGQPSEVAVVVEIEPRALATLDPDVVVADIRRTLASEFALASTGIVLVRKGMLPRTTSGKIQRRRARQELLEGALAVAHIDGIVVSESAPTVDAPVA
jgi:acyl-CoA synthetase (AMP-forming)/AMP-acid ligase II